MPRFAGSPASPNARAVRRATSATPTSGHSSIPQAIVDGSFSERQSPSATDAEPLSADARPARVSAAAMAVSARLQSHASPLSAKSKPLRVFVPSNLQPLGAKKNAG